MCPKQKIESAEIMKPTFFKVFMICAFFLSGCAAIPFNCIDQCSLEHGICRDNTDLNYESCVRNEQDILQCLDHKTLGKVSCSSERSGCEKKCVG